MVVITKTSKIKTIKEDDIIDITGLTSQAIVESQVKDGIVSVFVLGSTAAITTIEYEPGLKYDFPKMLSRMAPKDFEYKHDNTWHDGNGHSHIRASLIGPSLTVPVIKGDLMLGTWQQIVLLEMDTKPRERTVIFQIIGEQD
jgi:secondary thiamine-phosphate synthase enzyme